MGGDLHPVDVEHPDVVPAHPTRGHGVEELGVFVPFTNGAELAALLPVRSFLLNHTEKLSTRLISEPDFLFREETRFFEEIHQINHKTTIIDMGGDEPM
jgi:hypothetical protein